MSQKTTAELEHNLKVNNAQAVAALERQAAAYDRLAASADRAQASQESRARQGVTGFDAETMRLVRLARADKNAARYTDSAALGFSNEDMMKRWRAEQAMGMPAAQKKELERVQAIIAGGAKPAGGGGGIGGLIRGAAGGVALDSALEFGTTAIRDYHEGQKSMGRALKDAARETAEGIPIVGGFIKNVRKFSEQLLSGGEIAGTLMSVRMSERGGQIALNRMQAEDRVRPYILDASASRARADAMQEQATLAYVNRNRLDPTDERILAARRGVAEAEANYAGVADQQQRARSGAARTQTELDAARKREQDLLIEQRQKGLSDGRQLEIQAEIAKVTKEREALEGRLAQRREQGAQADKAAAQAVYELESKRLELKKAALEVAKEEVQKYKDKALAFDQMDPEQQMALSMAFDRAKSDGYQNLSADERRMVLGSGLAGEELRKQAADAAAQNQLFQAIMQSQGAKPLQTLQANEQAAQTAFDQAAPQGYDAKVLELKAEFERGVATAFENAIPAITDAITKQMATGLFALASQLKMQEMLKNFQN